jgi:ABC-type transport system involved in multi-copper enzyme maturation permease subunit
MINLSQLRILTRLTAAETLRQPVCLLLTLACMIATTVAPLMTAHNFGESGRLARDGGLAFHLMFGLLITCYAACAALDRERKSGTASAVLSKPVDRWTYFIAKFLGISAVVAIFSTCASLTTLLAQRIALAYTLDSGFSLDTRTAWLVMLSPVLACGIGAWRNYQSKQAFESTALRILPALLCIPLLLGIIFSRTNQWGPAFNHLQWKIVPASLLITLGLLVFAAIALSLAVRLSLIPILYSCFALLLAGLAMDYVLSQTAIQSTPLAYLYALLPNWQHFWMADAIADGKTIGMTTLWKTTLYAALYICGILCLGGATFQNAEVS